MTLYCPRGSCLKFVSVARSPRRMVLGFGRSVAIVSTSFWLSGRATSFRRSGPEIALRTRPNSVDAGALEVQAATPTYGRSRRATSFDRFLKTVNTVPEGTVDTRCEDRMYSP